MKDVTLLELLPLDSAVPFNMDERNGVIFIVVETGRQHNFMAK
jgi:hypothetical protein